MSDEEWANLWDLVRKAIITHVSKDGNNLEDCVVYASDAVMEVVELFLQESRLID